MNTDVYSHGVYVSEVATTLIPTVTAATPTFCVGTSAVHLATSPVAANTPVLCSNLAEYVEHFGWSGDFTQYTNEEAAQVAFQLFRVAPVVFVNVLDAGKHGKQSTAQVEGVSNPATLTAPLILSTLKVSTGEKPVEASVIGVTGTDPINIPAQIDATDFVLKAGDETLTLTTDYTVSGTTITLTEDGAQKIDGALTFISGENTYLELVADVDYTAEHDSSGNVILTVISTGKVVGDKISLSYTELDASTVTNSDVIGGVDITTGKNTGMELVEEIFPRFGVIPGQLIAPKFSTDSAVAAVLKAKAHGINGVFNGMAIADLPTSTVRKYTDVNLAKNLQNYTDPFLIATYPKVALSGVQYHLSTQLAAVMCVTDADNDDIPFNSPSNKSLQCDQTILEDGTDIFLGKSQANYLNGSGIVTALNFIGGWRAWGNRTSAYPGTSDPKDSFISIRRMMNYIGNTLVTSFWSRIDEPINRGQIESLIDEANLWFNGLTARGALIGGRVSFLEEDNPATELLNGAIHFRVYVAPPPPAEKIEFILSYDADYLSTLYA